MKQRIIQAALVIVMGAVLAWLYRPEVFEPDYGMASEFERPLKNLAVYNSRAKTACTDTATYLTKLETRGENPSDMDGAYWGSLLWEKKADYEPTPLFDGSRGDFEYYLKKDMGGSYGTPGYYCIVINEGRPAYICWSSSIDLLSYAEHIADRFTETLDPETEPYAGGEWAGRYPKEMTYPCESLPEWFEEAGVSIVPKTEKPRLSYGPLQYFLMILPLGVYIAVCAVKKAFFKRTLREM